MMKGKLKGFRGLVETLSIAAVIGFVYYHVFMPKPEVMTQGASYFYGATAFLGVLGGIGLAYTLGFRMKMKDEYCEEKKTVDQVKSSDLPLSPTVGKAEWSPLKKWSILLGSGLAIWGIFIVGLLVLA